MDTSDLSQDDVLSIVELRHDAPQLVLGPHVKGRTAVVVRAFLPHADRAYLRIKGEPPRDQVMVQIHPAGLFAATVSPADARDYEFLAVDRGGTVRRQRDAYACRQPSFGAEDERLFTAGRHDGLFEILGAHPREQQWGRWRRLRRLGAGGAAGQRRRHLQRLGRPLPPDDPHRRGRDMGPVRARGSRGRALQVRDQDAGRRAVPEARPVRRAGGAAAGLGLRRSWFRRLTGTGRAAPTRRRHRRRIARARREGAEARPAAAEI